MLNDDLNRRSCLASAANWQRQAANIREHAQRRHLHLAQRDALLGEAEACDQQAIWWLVGADDYAPKTERETLIT